MCVCVRCDFAPAFTALSVWRGLIACEKCGRATN